MIHVNSVKVYFLSPPRGMRPPDKPQQRCADIYISIDSIWEGRLSVRDRLQFIGSERGRDIEEY